MPAWYKWKWQISVLGRVCWLGWTLRPGWKPWLAHDQGIIRAGWGPLDVGYVHLERRHQSLKQQGY